MDPARLTLLHRAFRSGSSEFWRARVSGPGFSRPVLLKRLPAELAADPRLVEQERTEALLTAHLVHPNILTVLDYTVHEGQPTTVHENITAIDLLHLLERATAERRRLPARFALHILRGVLAALGCAHTTAAERLGVAAIAHGNLSPTSVLLDLRGHVLVRDFGVPLQAAPTSATEPFARLGRLHGKPGYMSPELVTRGLLSPRSDLFAAGTLLFELLTFRRLFTARDTAETLRKVARADIEERLSRLGIEFPASPIDTLTRALARQPDDRFPSAAAMLAALDAEVPPTDPSTQPELAAFIAELAPPLDEETRAPDGTVELRPRSGRRAPSRLILPADAAPTNAPPDDDAPRPAVVLDELEAWSDANADALPPPLPPLPEVSALLAGIDPVGPPPLPDEAPPALPLPAHTRARPRPG